ncbi:MAG: hypothetical protein PUC41_05670 [Oscillospiraceae bacterium]|nr:hypothetical protein [Oscillospiraceae bacterium]
MKMTTNTAQNRQIQKKRKKQEQKETQSNRSMVVQHGLFKPVFSVPIFARMPFVLRAFFGFHQKSPPQGRSAKYGTDSFFTDLLRMG